MAVKRKKPTTSNRKKKKARVSFLKNEKFRFILGVFVLLISAFLLIAFISFLFYGAADQSKLDLKWSELVFKSDIKVDNKAGKTGAYLSELIFNQGFGIASFLFIYLLIITGFNIIGRNLVKYGKSVVFSLVILIWLSVALGLIFTKTGAGSSIYIGGQYGFVLSSWLSSLIGVTGLVFLLFISALAIVIIRFENCFVKRNLNIFFQ